MHAPYVSMKSGLGDRNNEFSVMMDAYSSQSQ